MSLSERHRHWTLIALAGLLLTHFAAGQYVPAVVNTPAPGTTLLDTTATFKWSSVGASQYAISIGTTPGASDIYQVSAGTALSTTVSGLPSNGAPFYVRLSSTFGATTLYNDYQFVAATSFTGDTDGQAATQTLMAKLHDDSNDAFISVLSDSTGFSYGNLANPTINRWVSRLVKWLAPQFPSYTVKIRQPVYNTDLNAPAAWAAWTTVQTGTGSHTLWVSNGSVPGGCTLYMEGADTQTLYPTSAPDLIIVALGHNQGNYADNFLPDYENVSEVVARAYPGTNLLLVAQNPETDAVGYARLNQFAQRLKTFAAARNYGFVNVFSAFVNYGPSWANDLMGDSVHPNDAGMQVWANEAAKAFVLGGNAAIRKPSVLDESASQLISNGNFSNWTDPAGMPDGWAGIGVTASKDFSHSESPTGYSLQLATSGTSGYITQPLPMSLVRGQWVTVNCRVYVPSGQSSRAGRCGLWNNPFGSVSDLRSDYFTTTYQYGTDGFRWTSVSKYIDPSSAYARVYLWASDDNTTSTVSFDRVTVTLGRDIRDSQSPKLTPPSYLLLTSPSGGETWRPKSTQRIEWTSSGITGPVDLKLLKAGSGYVTIASGIPVGAAGHGTFDWTVPDTVLAGIDYKVRILNSTNTAQYSISNGNFSILPNITVTSPNGGQILTPSNTKTITWSSSGIPGNVTISLLKGGSGYLTIASVAASTGAYSWKIPATVPNAGDYRVRVMSASDSSVYDSSDADFTITAGYAVATPAGGQSWSIGTTQSIKWNYTGESGTVDLKLLKNGIAYLTIANGVPVGSSGVGSFNWTIPASVVTGTDYKVRVMNSTNSTQYAVSDTNFTITAP